MRTVLCVWVILLTIVCPAGATIYTQPLTPDAQTIALWHMDGLNGSGSDQWVSNDPLNATNELSIIGSGADPVGQIVAGPTGTNAIGISQGNNPWERFQTRNAIWNNSYETVKVEGWFNYNDILGSTRNIVEADAAWILQRWSNGSVSQIGWRVNFSDGSNGQVWLEQAAISGFSGTWLHFTAMFDQNGQMSLNLFDQGGTFNETATADFSGKTILDSGNEWIYAGYGRQIMAFDDIRISTVPEPATCALIGLGALLLRRKA